MYGKVFESIYDGTLAGNWQAIVTMQQLIVLASADGVVDMTPDAIARRTTIPLDIIAAGLEHLSKPDPYSRTPGEEGKRIELLDEHRPWGWRLVNFAKYRGLRNMGQKLEADRQRVAEKRKKNKDVAIVSRNVANVAHADADADAEAVKAKPLAPSAARVAAGGPANGVAVACIPLNDGTEFGITAQMVTEFERLYPAVDVQQTLNEIRGWNLANPLNRKTRSGVLRHVNRWLSREQNRGA